MVRQQSDDLENVKRKWVVLRIETNVQIRKKKIHAGSSVKHLSYTKHVRLLTIYDIKK